MHRRPFSCSLSISCFTPRYDAAFAAPRAAAVVQRLRASESGAELGAVEHAIPLRLGLVRRVLPARLLLRDVLELERAIFEIDILGRRLLVMRPGNLRDGDQLEEEFQI